MDQPSDHGPLTLAIDIGGTGIKAMVLDSAGQPVGQQDLLPTPQPATPGSVMEVLQALAARQGAFDRVAVGFPGVVRQGVTITAPNLHRDWHGFPFATMAEHLLSKPVRIANDADVQGFGAIRGFGVEMVLTLGTGLGSALFVDGILVPNLEVAHHPFADGRTYEQWLGQRALEEIGEEAWRQWLNRALELLYQTFNYDTIYLGGGNSRRLSPAFLPQNSQIVPNVLGLLGGLALWTGLPGTTLFRAPHAQGATCEIPPSSGPVAD